MKIAHICLYPDKDEKHVSSSGVASYTKNLLTHMPSNERLQHYVLCGREVGKAPRYQDGNVMVIRCFDKSWRFVAQLHKQLKTIRPDVIHIQQELSLFGSLVTSYLLPVLVWLWRHKATITLHGVVNIKKVDRQFVRANGYAPAPVWMVRLGLLALYWPLAHLPKRVVVHEPYFKRLLVAQYGADGSKVAVIPHGVEDFTGLTPAKARKLLNIGLSKKVVLFMGYAAGYKGIDLLIKGFAAYAKAEPNAYLIVGAGAHPKLKNDRAYQAVYEGYKQLAAELLPSSQYRWAGFIPEADVAAYYSASDVSVYPYTVALSSSGPMAFAIGFNKPFLASVAFADVFDRELVFEATPEALAKKLHEFFGDTSHFDKQVSWLRTQRLWSRTSLKTAQLYKQIG